MASGNAFKGDPGLAFQYDAYNAGDFASGGIENPDALSADMALLREIIEEKYVSTFGTIMPFVDFTRIRKSDGAIAMPLPINDGSTYPERFLIAQDEINGNANAPSPIPDIFTVTPVNQ